MVEIIIVILVILWLLGYFEPVFIPALPQTGDLVHVILIIAVIFTHRFPGASQAQIA